MLRFISLFVFSEHCVQDGQQFTHTVNQRHFFGFSGCWQMHVPAGTKQHGQIKWFFPDINASPLSSAREVSVRCVQFRSA